jgi:hypothetical protein
VLRHKTKDSISQEKNVIATILDDSVDDLVPLLTSQDAERLIQFQKAFWLSVEDVCGEVYDLYRQIDKGQEQKEYAIVVNSTIPKTHQGFMYQLRKGVPVKDLVIEQIRKSLSNQTKIDNNRWLFGNIQW